MVILKRNFSARHIIVENACDDSDEHVTIDLSVGDRYQKAGQPRWYDLAQPIALRPRSCILVKTHERITIPADVFGILCSKGSLSANGLIVSNTKVDPLFGDQLNVPIFNAGRRTLRIRPGMRFCCVSFHTLEQSIPDRVYRRAITQQVPRRTFIDWFRDNSIVLTLAITFLAFLATVVFGMLPWKRGSARAKSVVVTQASVPSALPEWSPAASISLLRPQSMQPNLLASPTASPVGNAQP
jgi:deoxycytidine triphosphate deaminase